MPRAKKDIDTPEIPKPKSEKAKAKELKWHRFIEHYMQTGNQTEAYKLAGFQPGTDLSARVSASNLMRHPWVALELEKRYRAMVEGTDDVEIPDDESLKILVADRNEIYQTLTRIMRDEFSTTTEKMKAAEQLSKLHGLYETKIEINRPKNMKKALKETLGFNDEEDDEDEFVDD